MTHSRRRLGRSPLQTSSDDPKTICEDGALDGGLDLDFDLLAAADARIQGLPELRNTESFVALHRGEVSFERDYLASPPAYFAGGHGGQYIYVVPALDLVVVTTAEGYAVSRPFGRALRTVIESYAVRAVRS